MSFSSYLLSIAGISIATIIIETIMPEGNVSKFVRAIASMIVVCVIIAPLPGLINSGKLKNLEISGDIYLDENLLSSINYDKAKSIEKSIKETLKTSDINADITIFHNSFSADFLIQQIVVFVAESNNLKDETMTEFIKRTVKKYVLIEDEKIFIYV